MANAFEVYPYSIDELVRLVAEKADTDPARVRAKRHLTYFEGYFATLGARSIVVENDYVDRDYLEDFAGYYVRCFHTYGRTCTRLHFFTREVTAADLDALLSAGGATPVPASDVQANYLGFIVLKPLPQSMIGRTCLKTYPDDGDRRQYPNIRPYDASLFGIGLKVETLAFQEQDTVAAACATSALWSAFQGTGSMFQHSTPSPVEITRAATAHSPSMSRVLPNEGLTAFQMAEAIRSVGLEPLVLAAGDDFTLKASVYAYLRAKIPPVLVATLVDPTVPAPQADIGLHAVTVTGFSLGAPGPVADPDGLQLRAFRIDKLYAHDDQVGPFARVPFIGGGLLGTSSLAEDGVTLLRARPNLLIVPLYHKIRIRLHSILDMLVRFDYGVESLRAAGHVPLPERIEWDLYLTTVNPLKSELLSAAALQPAYRREVLLQPMPRFLWRATASAGGATVLDLLFDATDIERGPFFVRAIEYHPQFSTILRAVGQGLAAIPQAHGDPGWPVWSWFAAQP